MKNICKFLMIIFIFSGFSSLSAKASTIVYDGQTKEFEFLTDSEYSSMDLFEKFKEVMPGDKLTDSIIIKNSEENKVKIKVYMRSLGAEESSEEFLSQINLTVKQKDNSNLFSASANQTAQLTDWVYIGTVYSGGEIPLELTLDVPASINNDFQNAIGNLDWQFKAEEFPVSKDDPQPPKTGDETPILLWKILIISCAVTIISLIEKKEKKEEII